MTCMTNTSRHQAGAPASQGGEFKAQNRTEADVSLNTDNAAELTDFQIVRIWDEITRRVALEETSFFESTDTSYGTNAKIAAARALIEADRNLRPATPALEMTQWTDPLPEYPEGISEAQVTFGFGDENPTLYVYFTIDNEIGVTLWQDQWDRGEWSNSIDSGNEATGWDEDTNEKFLTWAKEVSGRVTLNAYRSYEQTMTGADENAVVNAALGK